MRQGHPYTYWLTCLLLSLATSDVLCQDFIFDSKHFSIEDGLSSRFVRNVVQDDQGFIWVGTSNGVNRFDGQRFKAFNTVSSQQRPNNDAFLYKAHDGKIWVNYHQRVVEVLDPVTGIAIPLEEVFPIFAGKEVQLFNIEDSKAIWGAIDTKTFFRYDGDLKVSKPIRMRKEVGSLTAYAPTPWGTLLLVDSTSILEYDFDGKVLSEKPSHGLRHVVPIFADSSLLMLATVWDAKLRSNVIQMWEIQENGAPQRVNLTKAGAPFSLGRMKDLILPVGLNVDDNGNIWVALQDKLLIFDRKGAFLAEESGEDNQNWLESRQVFFDVQHQAWVCGTDGVYTISWEQSKFRKLLQAPGLGHSVRGITTLGDDKSLLACTYDGVFKIDLNTGTYSKLNHEVFFGVCKASDGRIWFGAHAYHTFSISSRSLHFVENKIAPEILRYNELLRPFEDTIAGKIYYGCLKRGLVVFNENTQQLEPYRPLNQFPEFGSLEVLHLCPTKDAIWIATNKGVYKMDREKGIVARFNQFPQNYIYYISADQNGVFWLATRGGGLLRWNSLDNTTTQFNSNEGLSNDVIYAAYDDGLGYLWLPSNYGLMRFEKSTGSIYNYLSSDGIPHEEFNSSSHYRGADGTFYFGGLKGITAFKPAEIIADKLELPLYVTDYRVLQGNNFEDRLPELRLNKKIEIQPDEKIFTLEFALLDYQASKFTYAWKLEGLYENWTYQEANTIRFNALPYGDYTLNIKAQGIGQNWSGNELSIPIRVVIPFYMTWKFVAICAILLTLLTIAFINYRTKRLRQEQVRLTALVEARTLELVDKNVELQSLNRTKDRLFTIIAHDLRSPLVTLGGLARKVTFLIRQNRIDEVRELGETVESAVTNVRNLLDNLLKWSIVQDGRFPHNPESFFAAEVAEEVVELYRNVASAKGIQLDYQNRGNARVHADRNSLSTIIRNLVDNAIKFTHENGTVRVTVESRGNAGIVEVSDTGVGIPSDKLSGIFDLKEKKGGRGTKGEKGNGIGLMLCRELSEINRGSIEAFNNTGGGAVFIVKLPLSEE